MTDVCIRVPTLKRVLNSRGRYVNNENLIEIEHNEVLRCWKSIKGARNKL